MKYNFLLPKILQMETCPETKGGKHYWIPGYGIESKVGGKIGVELCCKRCSKRHWIFLDSEVYELHKKNFSIE